MTGAEKAGGRRRGSTPGRAAHRHISREELERYRDADVPDLVGPGVRLLFIGVNPGLWTAATATPFAHPGNRFYPALDRAGILPLPARFADGFTPEDRRQVIAAGIGITNLVHRATVRADELTRTELRAGAHRVAADVARWRPAVVAVVGITAYRIGFGRPKAVRGRQEERLGGAELWVVPNPSGLNAHDTVDTLAAAYAEPARAAGLLPRR